MLVDITADQFENVNEQIVIAQADSTWYGAFDKSIEREADYRVIVAGDVRAHLEAVYEYVLEAEKNGR